MHSDVGWFGSKIAKKVSKAAKSVAKPVAKAAGGAVKVATGVTRPVLSNPVVSTALQGAQIGASFIPGVGTGVAAGLASAAALGRGESMRDAALAGARAAVPGGPVALAAFDTAVGLARGKRLDSAALAAARAQLPPTARAAFDAGLSAARGERIDRALMSGAVTAARDVVARVAPSRAMSLPDPLAAIPAARRALSSAPNGTVAVLDRALARAPALAAASPAVLARELQVSPVAARDALARAAGLRWRPLSRAAAALVRRHSRVPERALSLTDVGDIPVSATSVKLQASDLPYLIAKKYHGDSNRWHDLPAVNPGMKEVHKKDGTGKIIWSGLTPWAAGQVLNLPPTWPKLPSVPGLPSAPSSPSSPTATLTTTAVLQAKATLAAWSKTDGASSAGVAGYGTTLEDATPAWTARDGLMLASFSSWWNKTGRKPELAAGTTLTQAHADALRAWAEAKAQSAPTAPAPAPSAPEAPPAPSAPPALPAPTPSAPQATSPGWPFPWGAPDIPPNPYGDAPPPIVPGVLPTTPPPSQVATPTAPAPSSPSAPAKKDDGLGALALLAGVAALLT